MGSEILSRPGWGFMTVAYLATSLVTVILALGSLVLNKNANNESCASTVFCSPFFYTLPAIATSFSIITLILALIQTRLYYTRAITGIVVFISNTFAAVLWLIIIAIGWSSIVVSYDAPSRIYSLGVTGWFLWIRDAHNESQTLVYGRPVNNEWQPLVGSSLDTQDTNTISFSFGLLVMTHIIFILSLIMTVIGLVIHMLGASDGKSMSNWGPSKTGNTSKGPWVHPHALADKKAEEPVSSV